MLINVDKEWQSDLFEFELKQKIWKCLIHSFRGGRQQIGQDLSGDWQ